MANPIKADVSGLRETTKNARRDTGFLREIAVLDPATGAQVLVARLYYPGTVMRCSVWIAALASALDDAGVRLSRAINGVGDRAMIDACEATARAITGKRRFIVHEAHA
jgi:hypothetical protein